MEANQLILKCKKENVTLLLPYELFILFSLGGRLFSKRDSVVGGLTATQLLMTDSGHRPILMETSRLTSYLGVHSALLTTYSKVSETTRLIGRHISKSS